MKPSANEVNKISKGDPEIAGFLNGLFAVISKQSEHIEKLTERIENQTIVINEQAKQIDMQTKQINEQAKQIDAQTKQIVKLEKQVHELERQLGQNSNNSSKPPSSDGLRKPTNLRTPGGKKGAPKGHDGTTLRFSAQPDEVIVHVVSSCSGCSASLESVESQTYEKRQVFDIPPPTIRITEHRAQKKCCPQCGLHQRAVFPEEVKAPTQYGTGFAAWTAYFHTYQMIPLDRISRMFAELTGYRPSEATLLSFLQTMHQSLASAEQTIRHALLQKPVVHADETGCRIEGKTEWVHVVSDADWTLLGVHPNRGSKGMDAIGFIPSYTGAVVHDCLPAYFKTHYTFSHALCNAHLLRECQGVIEHDGQPWAAHMKELLQESWGLVQRHTQDQQPLPENVIEDIKAWYDEILEQGETEWATSPSVISHTKGRAKKSKAANLGERFKVHKDAILRFIWDAYIPFDNNQAERDLRMVKVKQKVSGTFRTKTGAHIFARLRSVISSLLKQKQNILTALSHALCGKSVFE